MEREEITRVPIGDLKTHPALQPRDPNLLSTKDRVRQGDQSEAHISHMAQLLGVSKGTEVEPLDVAKIDGVLYVVDGHHRLRAYKRAKRGTVPAQVREMTWRQASHASKLANLTGTKLEMKAAQKRNALWHHLGHLTDYGRGDLPSKVSLRELAGRFGVSRELPAKMLRRIPEVIPEEYAEDQRDGITEWPHWKAVSTDRGAMYGAMPEGVRRDWKARKVAAGLVKLWEKYGADAMASGAELWASEQASEEAREERAAAARWVTEGAMEGEPEVEF